MEKIPNIGNGPEQDPEIKRAELLAKLESELDESIKWGQSLDRHPDDVKRIAKLQQQIDRIRYSVKLPESGPEVVVDENVDMRMAREEIANDPSLQNLYNQAKLNMTRERRGYMPNDSKNLSRIEVIKEMFRIIDEDLRSQQIRTMRIDLQNIIEKNRRM